MKTVIIVFFLLLFSPDSNAQIIRTESVIPKNVCGASMQFRMFTVQKIAPTIYVVAQRIGPGMNTVGLIKTLGRELPPNVRVNMMLKLIESKKIPMANGFEQSADFWEECTND